MNSRRTILAVVLVVLGTLTPGLGAAATGPGPADGAALQSQPQFEPDDNASGNEPVWQPDSSSDSGSSDDSGSGGDSDSGGDGSGSSSGDPGSSTGLVDLPSSDADSDSRSDASADANTSTGDGTGSGDISFQPSVVDEVDGVTQEDLDNGSITQDEYEALVTAQEEQNGSARSPLGGAQDVVETASDPAEAAKTVWERLAQLFASGMNLLVDQVFNEALGTPTINNDGAFGIFGTPEALETGEETPANQEATVYDAVASQNYVTIHKEIFMGLIMPMAVSIMFLLALLMLAAPITALITRQQVGSMLASGVFVILIIVVSWEYAALMHALSDAAVQYVLPETDQILNQEATTFGGGVAVAIGIYFGGWSAAVMLVAIHTARHLLLFVYPAVLPLFLLMAYWGGHRRVKQIGSFFVWQWYGLLVMNLPTAILLRFADEVGWQLFPDGAAFEILNLGSTIAIFLLAVAIPLAVSGSFFLVGLSMRGATAGAATAAASRFTPTPRTAATHGGAAARSAAGRLKRGGRTAASRAHTKYRESRFPSVTQEKYATDGGTRTDGGSPSRSGTTTQSSGVSPDQRKRAAEQKQRQRNLESQRERARQERDSYRK